MNTSLINVKKKKKRYSNRIRVVIKSITLVKANGDKIRYPVNKNTMLKLVGLHSHIEDLCFIYDNEC